MPEEVATKVVTIAPATQVTQYGDRSIHADHVENMTVNVYGDRNSEMIIQSLIQRTGIIKRYALAV